MKHARRLIPPPATAVLLMLLVMVSISVIMHLARIRDRIGDVDFFYYLCYARDLTQGADHLSDNRYFYFPGVYRFWSAVMAVSGTDLGTMQTVVILIVLCNALLVGLIVAQFTRRGLWCWFAALWYLVLCSRFQGLTGVTEPLATVPWLLGILLWGGRPLDHEIRWWRVAGWAVMIGLTVYVKQQAGLLALGTGWFVWQRYVGRRPPLDWKRLSALALIAATTLVAAVLAQGDGWLPLTYGTGALTRYTSQGSFLVNVYVQFRADPAAGDKRLGCLSTCLILSFRKQPPDPWFNTVGVLMLSAAATLLQFGTRAYHHYLLLAIPGIVVSSCILLEHARRRLSSGGHRRLVTPSLVAACGIVLALPTHPGVIHPWAVSGPRDLPPSLMVDADLQDDLSKLRRELTSIENIYVIPPRFNVFYYQLEKRSASPDGYSFQLPVTDEIPWDRYQAVILYLKPTEGFSAANRNQLQEALRRAGFEPLRLQTVQLWRRK